MVDKKLTLRPECPHCHPEAAYCPECGEKRFAEKDFSFRRFIKDLFNDFTDFDSKLLKTFLLLTFRPGFLSVEYCRGVNVPYIKPLRLFLIIALIHFLAFGHSGRADVYSIDGGIFARMGLIDALHSWPALQPHLQVNFDHAVVDKTVKDILGVLIYIILFVAAGFFSILFRKKRPYYSENLIFFLHVISAAFLRNFLLLPFLILSPPLGIVLVMTLQVVYVVFAIRRFYEISFGLTLLILVPTMVFIGVMMSAVWSLSVAIALWK